MCSAMIETRVTSAVYDGELENPAPLGKIGVIALATDLTLESDLRRMLPRRMEVYTNRVLNANPLTLENLRAMTGDIQRAAKGIAPGAKTDAVIYGCTSGSAAIGVAEIRKLIRAAHAQAEVITPLTAAADALGAIGVKRLSVLTPYIAEINRAMADAFSSLGFAPVNVAGMEIESDVDAACLPEAAILRAARECCDSSADALFISCTALRASGVVAQLEDELNIPVLCSNQTLAWAALRALNCNEAINGYGRLLEREWR